jgi:succinyl-diaminopimelate desuccinylase
MGAQGEVILTATVDEEIGGIGGLGACIEEGVVHADYGISCDGKQDNIIISNQGRFKGKIITQGLAVHSSMAHQGVNAIEIMAKIVQALQKHDRELRTRTTRIPAPPVSGAKHIYPTVNVGTIIGGLKENIVPDYCAITFSRRVTPDELLNDARKELLQIVARAAAGDPKSGWKYEEMNTREPSYTPTDDPYVLLFKAVAERILGRKFLVCGGLGGNDVCFMRNILKIPAVQFGPARSGSNTHKADENIKIDHILDAASVYAALIIELIGVEKAVE